MDADARRGAIPLCSGTGMSGDVPRPTMQIAHGAQFSEPSDMGGITDLRGLGAEMTPGAYQ